MTKQTRIQRHLDNLSNLAQENVLHYEDGTEYNIYDLKELMAKELVAIEEIQEEQENTKLLQTNLTVKELGNQVEDICDILEGASKGGDIPASTYESLIQELDEIATLLKNIDEIELEEV